MIHNEDVMSHIQDYVNILAMVQAEPGIPATKDHDVAMTIMLVHELHRGQHISHEHHKP